MQIKTKALIYRYTGIYLATKEENEFLLSKEFWDEFRRTEPYNEENEFSDRDAQGLILGMWQCEHKFYRPISFLKFKGEGTAAKTFFGIIAWFDELLQTFEINIRRLLK